MSSPADFGLLVDGADLERLVTGQHHDPHHLLGAHPERDGEGRAWVVIRGWRPDAVGMVILAGEQRIEMRRVHPAGVFAGVVEGPEVPAYRLETTYPDGAVVAVETIPTGIGPRSGSSTFTCWPRVGMRGCGAIWGRRCGCIRGRLARRSRCGRRAPRR